MYKPEKETVTFLFDSMLPEGRAKVHISFTCEINDKLKGFYRSKYTTPCGQERFSAVTQFEVIFCFHLRGPVNLLSNMSLALQSTYD